MVNSGVKGNSGNVYCTLARILKFDEFKVLAVDSIITRNQVGRVVVQLGYPEFTVIFYDCNKSHFLQRAPGLSVKDARPEDH